MGYYYAYMVDKEIPNVDNCLVNKTQTQTFDLPDQQPDASNWTSDWSAGSSSGVTGNVSGASDAVQIPPSASQPSDYIRDKERRLRQQNLETQRLLSRLPKVAFGFNRFGPLMFLLAFGIVGMYFGVMSFASPGDTAGRAINLSVEPSQRRLVAGDTLTVRVWADSLSVPVDAVKAQLAYDKDSFDFVAIDAIASSFSSDDLSEPNEQGVLLSRRASTGLIGRQLVASVVLRAKATTGNVSLWFDDSSKLMHATDQTNVLQRTSGSTYFVSSTSSSP